jgi:hypothetical protein
VAGTLALLSGALALLATAFAYVLSLTDVVDPPNWVRILGLVWLPLGFFGAPLAYTVARRGPGRARGLAGLVLAAVGLVLFVVLLFVAG